MKKTKKEKFEDAIESNNMEAMLELINDKRFNISRMNSSCLDFLINEDRFEMFELLIKQNWHWSFLSRNIVATAAYAENSKFLSLILENENLCFDNINNLPFINAIQKARLDNLKILINEERIKIQDYNHILNFASFSSSKTKEIVDCLLSNENFKKNINKNDVINEIKPYLLKLNLTNF